MSEFFEAIDAARTAGRPIQRRPETDHTHGGPEVQLSVRVPEGLRTAVAATATAKRMTVTAFVENALRQAVIDENDSFAGLAAEFSRRVLSEIHSGLEEGTYRDVAASVEVDEAWS